MSVSRVPSSPLSLDFIYAVAAGNFPGLSIVTARGVNSDIDTGETEDCVPWASSGANVLYAFQTGAVALEAISSAAGDSAAGAGARTIRVESLSDAFVPQAQDVVMNGTTAVALTGTHRRVNAAYVLTVGGGTAQSNAGDLQVRVSGGGVQQAYMLAQYGLSYHCVCTVPAGYNAYVLAYYAEL